MALFLGVDGLSYSGAATASFFLLRIRDNRLLDSGVLYATSGYTRFDKRRGTVARRSPPRERQRTKQAGDEDAARQPEDEPREAGTSAAADARRPRAALDSVAGRAADREAERARASDGKAEHSTER